MKNLNHMFLDFWSTYQGRSPALAGLPLDIFKAGYAAAEPNIVELKTEVRQLTGDLVIERSMRDGFRKASIERGIRVDELERERDEFAAYALAVTKTLTGLTAGGSEYFAGRIGDFYKADLPFCAQRIRERTENLHGIIIQFCDEAKKAREERDAALAEIERLKLQIPAGVNYDADI